MSFCCENKKKEIGGLVQFFKCLPRIQPASQPPAPGARAIDDLADDGHTLRVHASLLPPSTQPTKPTYNLHKPRSQPAPGTNPTKAAQSRAELLLLLSIQLNRAIGRVLPNGRRSDVPSSARGAAPRCQQHFVRHRCHASRSVDRRAARRRRHQLWRIRTRQCVDLRVARPAKLIGIHLPHCAARVSSGPVLARGACVGIQVAEQMDLQTCGARHR
jgi:hypothetical protein